MPANTITVFTGKSGAVKSTLIDIILGLLIPDSGALKIDDTIIQPCNAVAWQRNVAYVPHQIHIADSTLMENIAFGVPDSDIDHDMLGIAAEFACIDTLAEELGEGYMTTLGKQGRQLSGRQGQRIGVARALYHNPGVLVLDEATSALDSATEKDVMNSLRKISRDKIIILISHRREVLDFADFVFNVSKRMVKLECA